MEQASDRAVPIPKDRSNESILSLAARHYGRPLAIVVGLACFFVVVGFQFGNNLGIATALNGITGINPTIFPIVFAAMMV